MNEWLSGRGEGLCNVFVLHATAGVAIFELGAGSESDVEETVGRLLPRDDDLVSYRFAA
ncbi:MAG: YjbQ family protein [Euzebyaceae bacterium]|nr:YjbQ family protein [Euzebyaceae bacterium]